MRNSLPTPIESTRLQRAEPLAFFYARQGDSNDFVRDVIRENPAQQLDLTFQHLPHLRAAELAAGRLVVSTLQEHYPVDSPEHSLLTVVWLATATYLSQRTGAKRIAQ